MRVRKAATVDRDSVSPDAIRAMIDFLVGSIEEIAEQLGAAINWNTLHVYTRRTRHGDHRVIAWAKVIA